MHDFITLFLIICTIQLFAQEVSITEPNFLQALKEVNVDLNNDGEIQK